ncbi:hypothetical protein U1Q18_006908 [Sarracenia purpurea var. burkii]
MELWRKLTRLLRIHARRALAALRISMRVDLVVRIRSHDADGVTVVRRAVGSETPVGAYGGCEWSFWAVTRLWVGCFRSGYRRLAARDGAGDIRLWPLICRYLVSDPPSSLSSSPLGSFAISDPRRLTSASNPDLPSLTVFLGSWIC